MHSPIFQEVHVEVTTHCNFRCFFCPLPRMQRKHEHMPAAMAVRALDEIADSRLSARVAYHLMGEPLLHPDLDRILEHAHRKGLTNRVVTNGFLLSSPDHVRKLAAADVVDISLRAHDPETFARLSSAGDFRSYLDGIRAFLASRREGGTPTIRLRIFPSPGLPGTLKQLGMPDDVRFRVRPGRSCVVLDETLSVLIEPSQDWLGEKKKVPSRWFGSCAEFSEGFSVLVNGDVTPCCWDSDGKNAVGNFVSGGGLRAVLDGEAATTFRRRFRHRRVPTACCAECLGRATVPRSLAYQALAFLHCR